MKPKFALDLSHEGINLLHRRRGGWSLVGSVDLDDPEMGAHLADLRRRAAALESGGLSCKIIIPNSQVLYTTIEAPGPDDIAREVQIRAGLDGLTPYPVGELVFDWRAAGERARVAVLARETMDEAETFAVEHRFNPVSFVARPPAGEFSGEPFFGKTRAANKILGPSERVEPDASPVPRKPSTMEPYPAPEPPRGGRPGPAPAVDPEPALDPVPHSPGDLAWHPPAEPAPAPTPTFKATPAPARTPDPVPAARPDPSADQPLSARPEPRDPPRPRPIPEDDPFAELDAIRAELSGDPDAAAAFRARSNRPQSRPVRPPSDGEPPVAPPLAPFPPTSDEAEALPTPAQTVGRARPQPAPSEATPSAPTGAEQARRPAPGQDRPTAPRPDGSGRQAAPKSGDDTPAQPGVAFSTRRTGDRTTTTATPTARRGGPDTPPAAPPETGRDTGREGARDAGRNAPQPSRSPETPPAAQARGSGGRKEASAADRRRADMADALSRPLPGRPASTSAPTAPDKPAGRGSISSAVRGAAGGLRSLGQRRGASKEETKAGEPRPEARDTTPTRDAGPDKPKRPDTSIAALMRGAGSRAARISPDQFPDRGEDEPGLLDPGVAAPDAKTPDDASRRVARTEAPTPAPPAPEADKPEPKPEPPARPVGPAPDARDIPAKPPEPMPAAETAAPPPPAKAKAAPIAETPIADKGPAPQSPASKPTLPKRKPLQPPKQKKEQSSEAEALTVFGARRATDNRGGRKYMGVVLTLLLLLAMAVIGMWSTFFVDDTEPALFNPDGDATAPVVPDEPVPGDTPPEIGSPEPDATTTPDTATDEIPPADTDVVTPTPQVLSPDEAESLYAETQIWQRAPDVLGDPFTPALDLGTIIGPGDARGTVADPAAAAAPEPPVAPGGAVERAEPLPPPPADTVFDLGADGLVAPTPDGTVSPSGVVIFEGAPTVTPPTRPEPPALPEIAPGDAPENATQDDAALDDAALEQAVEQAVEAAAALTTDVPPADPLAETPEGGPVPGTEDLPTEAPADGDAIAPDQDAQLDVPAPDGQPDAEAVIETAAADAASIEAAVDAAATNFVDATELAVATSVKPNRRPADIEQIVNAAMARAAAAPAAPEPPATTTPAIPTSASVANQATVPNAIDLGEINLLGVSGPTNARRALVRMANGRYVTVKVGDRLDGGQVTSITADGLTYQKGNRNFTLQLLPLG